MQNKKGNFRLNRYGVVAKLKIESDWKDRTLNCYLPAVMGVTPTLHRSLPNIELLHNPSLIAIFVMFAPNGGKPCDGNNAPLFFFRSVFK